ncbi:hypothetical protein GCM10020216_016080 [Nonomuraea helvata]
MQERRVREFPPSWPRTNGHELKRYFPLNETESTGPPDLARSGLCRDGTLTPLWIHTTYATAATAFYPIVDSPSRATAFINSSSASSYADPM